MLFVSKYKLTFRMHLTRVKSCVFRYYSGIIAPNKMITSVQDFYDGKSVFLIGGTGFLGKVILEKLLYTCTKLDKVYLFVRERDEESISRRIRNIFENPLFRRLKDHMPDNLKKVVPITGDLREPNLGIKADDVKMLTNKVSIVLHTAASVNFNNPWDVNLKINYEGTVKVLNLCQRIKHIEVFVYVSSAYAFTRDIGDNVVEEKVYPAPANIEQVYDFADKYNKDKEKTKDFLGGLFDCYTYTKALADVYVAENHGNIPTCIIRPSIVGPKFDEPQIGWLDNWYGPTSIFWNVSKGLNRVTYGSGNVVSDFIPVDYVANTCIVAAAKYDGCKKLRIYNTCSSEVNPVTLGDAHKFFNEDAVRNGWSLYGTLDVLVRFGCFLIPVYFYFKRLYKYKVFSRCQRNYNKPLEIKTSLTCCLNLSDDYPLPYNILTKSRILVGMLTFLLQVLPAYMADFCLMITGKNKWYIKTMNRVIRLRNSLEFFSSNTWVIKSGNVRSLQSSLSDNDRQMFPCDPAQIDWKKFFHSYSQGVNKFLLSKRNNK